MRAHWEPLSGRGDVNGKSVQTVLLCNTPLTGVIPRNCGRIDRYGFALFHRGWATFGRSDDLLAQK